MSTHIMNRTKKTLKLMSASMLSCWLYITGSGIALADRATHWDQYQAGRQPFVELLLFILGAVAAIGLLYALSKITEKK